MTDRTAILPDLLIKHRFVQAADKPKLDVTAVKSSVARRSDKSSQRYIVSIQGKARYTVKFIPKNWNFNPDDIAATIAKYSQFTSVNVAKLAGHFGYEDGHYFVEEFLEAATSLDELIERGTVGVGQALELVRAIFLEIYGTGRRPSREFFDSQKKMVLAAIKSFVKEGIWGDFILAYVDKTIDEQGDFLREVYTSGDIIDRNIVLSNGQWYLIDYEYSHRTMFGFKDAFRNILYTRWARNYALADLYPPLKHFPPDVASMISAALEFEFQSGILEDEAAQITQKHLRYIFWNAIDPSIITHLDRRLGVSEDLSRQKEEEILRIRNELQQWKDSLAEKDIQIAKLESSLRVKTEESSQLQLELEARANLLSESRRRADELAKDIEIRQARIAELAETVEARQLRITQLTNWTDDLQHQIRLQGDKLRIQQSKLEETGAKLHSAEDQLVEKSRLYDEQVSNFIHVKSTLSYSIGRIATFPLYALFKLSIWLYTVADRLVGKLLWPRGSKRAMIMNALENLPDTIATATYLLRMHGISGLSKGIRDTWNAGTNLGILRSRQTPIRPQPFTHAPPSQPQRNPATPLNRRETPVVAETGVSVVIPVFNDADNLSNLLPSLLSQRGFTAIEVIVVDSGSTDNSVALAKEYGVKVIQIPQKDFSHSGSRNLGAEQASQEYLLLMTQDALPTSDTWLYNMYGFAKSEGLAAVSCMEIPRADVDLFSRVQLWFHYTKFLELGSKDKILTLPNTNDPLALRKHAQLTDVACLMKRDIFQKYKYRYEYGEDLDLGLRLISDQHKIGLMSSVKVIHSHRRPAYHHLKRAYVDRLVIAKILNEDPRNGLTVSDVLRDIISTWKVLSTLSPQNILQGKESITISELKSRIYDAVGKKRGAADSSSWRFADHPFIDSQFGQFLATVASLEKSNQDNPKQADHILSGLRKYLDIAFEYIGTNYTRVDQVIVEDVVDLLFKQFAVSCGAYFAGCDEGGSNGKTPGVRELIDELADRQILWNEKIVAGKAI